MNKLPLYHIQVNATFGTPINQLRRQLLSWDETRAMQELDPRIRYDIGENDCRPPQAKPAKAYATSFEAMLNRSL
jgi:hypothetical protein